MRLRRRRKNVVVVLKARKRRPTLPRCSDQARSRNLSASARSNPEIAPVPPPLQVDVQARERSRPSSASLLPTNVLTRPWASTSLVRVPTFFAADERFVSALNPDLPISSARRYPLSRLSWYSLRRKLFRHSRGMRQAFECRRSIGYRRRAATSERKALQIRPGDGEIHGLAIGELLGDHVCLVPRAPRSHRRSQASMERPSTRAARLTSDSISAASTARSNGVIVTWNRGMLSASTRPCRSRTIPRLRKQRRLAQTIGLGLSTEFGATRDLHPSRSRDEPDKQERGGLSEEKRRLENRPAQKQRAMLERRERVFEQDFVPNIQVVIAAHRKNWTHDKTSGE